jgi:hypothetical protein
MLAPLLLAAFVPKGFGGICAKARACKDLVNSVYSPGVCNKSLLRPARDFIGLSAFQGLHGVIKSPSSFCGICANVQPLSYPYISGKTLDSFRLALDVR